MKFALPIFIAGFAAIVASSALAQASNNTMDAASADYASQQQQQQSIHPDQNDRDKTARDNSRADQDCDPAAARRMGPNDPSDPPASGYPPTCRRDGD